MAAFDPHIIDIDLQALDRSRKLRGLGYDELSIVAGFQVHSLSCDGLKSLLAMRAAVTLTIELNRSILITTGQAPGLIDSRPGELDSISLRLVVVELLLDKELVIIGLDRRLIMEYFALHGVSH